MRSLSRFEGADAPRRWHTPVIPGKLGTASWRALALELCPLWLKYQSSTPEAVPGVLPRFAASFPSYPVHPNVAFWLSAKDPSHRHYSSLLHIITSKLLRCLWRLHRSLKSHDTWASKHRQSRQVLATPDFARPDRRQALEDRPNDDRPQHQERSGRRAHALRQALDGLRPLISQSSACGKGMPRWGLRSRSGRPTTSGLRLAGARQATMGWLASGSGCPRGPSRQR
jgi:hypothetical protein